MEELSTSKFIYIEDKKQRNVYLKLIGLVWHLSYMLGRDANDVLMEVDEVAGELMEEMVKGIKKYNNLPEEQLLIVIRTMFAYRIGELKYRFYKTHRKLGNDALSLESFVEEENTEDYDLGSTEEAIADPAIESNPRDFMESAERVASTRARLSDKAKEVFDIITSDNNPFITQELLAATTRAYAVFKQPSDIQIKPYMVARAIGMEESEVKRAFVEIKRAYREVINATE